MIKILSYGLLAIVLMYFIYGTTLFFFQDSLIYQPTINKFNECEYFNKNESVENDNYRYYYSKVSNESLVIIYHGNSGSACDRAFISQFFSEIGISTIIFEYPGYSDDNLKPSKSRIFDSIEEFSTHIKEDYNYTSVNLMGISIGSHMASKHANEQQVNSIIYVSGFNSLDELVQYKLPMYPTNLLLNEEYEQLDFHSLKTNKAIFIHSKDDLVVNYELGLEFYNLSLIENKKLFTIEGFGHNDILTSNDVRYEITKFLTEE